MLKRLLLVTGCWLLVTSLFAGLSFAEEVGFIKRMWRRILHGRKVEEKALPSAEEKPPITAPRQLTKNEKITMIKSDLSIFGDEISPRILDLVKQTDEEGRVIYKFKKKTGEVVNLEELDEETLSKLYTRVRNEGSLIRTERIKRQLQAIKQFQPPRVHQPPQPVVQPPPVPQMPRVYTPPKAPPPPPPQTPSQRR